MTVSSRTPEGFPAHCRLCGAQTNLEFSEPTGDAPCPACGVLLLRSSQLFHTFQRAFAQQLGVAPELITTDTFLTELGADSLDMVDLVMQLEELDPDLQIPESLATAGSGDTGGEIRTIGDAIRVIEAGYQADQSAGLQAQMPRVRRSRGSLVTPLRVSLAFWLLVLLAGVVVVRQQPIALLVGMIVICAWAVALSANRGWRSIGGIAAIAWFGISITVLITLWAGAVVDPQVVFVRVVIAIGWLAIMPIPVWLVFAGRVALRQ